MGAFKQRYMAMVDDALDHRRQAPTLAEVEAKLRRDGTLPTVRPPQRFKNVFTLRLVEEGINA